MSSPVAQTVPNVTLFLPSLPAGGMKLIGQAAAQLLRDLGLPVQSIDEISPESIRYITRGPEVLITLSPAPMDPKLTDDCERPEYGQALDQYALRKLELHRAVIGISIKDHRSSKVETRNRQALALTLRLARGLVGETGADLVLWEQNRVLYTVGEFSGLGQPSAQRRPAAAPRQSAPTSARAELAPAEASMRASASPAHPPGDDISGPAGPQRQGLHHRVEEIAAPLHDEALRRENGLQASAVPLVKPAEAGTVKRPRPPARISVVLRWFGAQFDTWLDADGMPSRKMIVSVYLMTALAAAISLPIGLGLAAYNLLRRESLKVTVPVLLGLAAAQASGWLDKAAAWVGQVL